MFNACEKHLRQRQCLRQLERSLDPLQRGVVPAGEEEEAAELGGERREVGVGLLAERIP